MTLEQIKKLEGRIIEYTPRFSYTIKEGVRRFKIKSVSHTYKHKTSGNTLVQCQVYDKDDNGKLKHRSLNVDLIQA